MSVIGFIPARSGSTRLKNKNIKILSGRPLIFWTVAKAIKSKKFDTIIFSSDSKKYYNILIKFLKKDKLDYHKIVFDHRDIGHSKKKSKIFDYLRSDLVKKFNLKKNDLLVQMLPTCPMRSLRSLKKIVNYSLKYKRNSFSVCEYSFHLSFGLSIKKKKWQPVFKNSPLLTGNTQSQSQKKFYHPNGSINCLYVKSLKSLKTIYTKASPIVVPKHESFDVDTAEDFRIVSKLNLNLNF